jgi:hypothetical protein
MTTPANYMVDTVTATFACPQGQAANLVDTSYLISRTTWTRA